ncbi:hypothetical protein Q7C36_020360 [Tachysurus vachellii]|uniref:Uncharacterized protein n=1 Tax=Tachysurus vachellii TaxID=175792 RepID=A0AA88LTI7_TACVA|nr:hypothetical protein Q7C36_020360 [Tachysurus vachellii]
MLGLDGILLQPPRAFWTTGGRDVIRALRSRLMNADLLVVEMSESRATPLRLIIVITEKKQSTRNRTDVHAVVQRACPASTEGQEAN